MRRVHDQVEPRPNDGWSSGGGAGARALGGSVIGVRARARARARVRHYMRMSLRVRVTARVRVRARVRVYLNRLGARVSVGDRVRVGVYRNSCAHGRLQPLSRLIQHSNTHIPDGAGTHEANWTGGDRVGDCATS